jgi:methionyl-tRNA synthetase
MKDLFEHGFIFEDTRSAAFDQQGQYLHEAYVSGECPHCYEQSDGNACEACGHPNECVDLINPINKLTGDPIEVYDCTRLYFKLSAFAEELGQYIKTADMPAHVATLSLEMIADGLPDICISHPSDWGIPFDLSGYEDHRIYVWFEMAFGYLWGASNIENTSPKNAMSAARAIYDGDTNIVHCYGFDTAYYHTLLFPAIHIALGLTPARTHIVNELLDLDGEKFSTSRRHLIWGRDYAASLPLERIASTWTRESALSI